MVKQVIIQLQDFNNEISEVPVPETEQTSFGEQPVIQVNNKLNLHDFKLTNELAKQAFIKFVSNNCCLAKAYEKKLKILNIDYNFVHKYTLETFTEKRQSCFDYNRDLDIETTDEEIPPIWSIKSNYEPIPFIDNSETLTVPNSEMIKTCSKCSGTSKRLCPKCLGIQRDNQEDKRCNICYGSNHVTCEVCKNGKINMFQILKITWKNNVDQYCTRSEIPDEKLKSMKGNVIYEDTGVRVHPINYAPENEINIACEKFTNAHEEKYLNKEKLLQQHHEISIITTATVHFEYGKKLGKFHCYYDNIDNLNIYCPKYSKNCCVGCLVC